MCMDLGLVNILDRLPIFKMNNSFNRRKNLSNYFNKGFDAKYFISLIEELLLLFFQLKLELVKNLMDTDIISFFGLLEKILWHYNDNLKFNGYKIKNFYVLLTIFFPQLSDHNKKYLTNTYNNIVQQLPLSGVILISGGQILLVKNCMSKTWSYPKGKICVNETPLNAAIRECYEETGYDVSNLINERNLIKKKYNKRIVYLYVINNVEYNYPFEPTIMNEISDIKWFKLSDYIKNKKNYNVYVNQSYIDLLNFLDHYSSSYVSSSLPSSLSSFNNCGLISEDEVSFVC